jgi:CDP-diacylglycerol--serine O-phosphatidyltransferase
MFKEFLKIANMLTVLNIICGFMSIYNVIEGDYELAGLLIIYAMFFDFLDGFAARLMKSESKFGRELDSYADFISFGIAPVILVLAVFYVNRSLFVDCVLFFYFCSIIYRLIRYNVADSKDEFSGIPSTFTGGFVAFLYVWFPNFYHSVFAMPFFIIMSLLTISSIPYKKLRITKQHQVFVIFVLLVAYFFLRMHLFLALFICYTLSGIYNLIVNKSKNNFLHDRDTFPDNA